MKNVILILLLIFLIGCAQPVVEPVDESTTTKVFVNDQVNEEPVDEEVVEEVEEVIDEKPVQDQIAQEPIEEPVEEFNMQDVIDTCDDLCGSDFDSYCEDERIIMINDVEVSGTCRAFAKKGNVDGFNRCQKFCKSSSTSFTVCNVDGVKDSNCDGKI